MIDATPTIDGCPVSLGDVLTGPQTGIFSNGRVKGWSPCGNWVYVAWLGVVPIRDLEWCCGIEDSRFARLYRPVAENRWESEAIKWNFAPREAVAA
jgi:hypothetical protein